LPESSFAAPWVAFWVAPSAHFGPIWPSGGPWCGDGGWTSKTTTGSDGAVWPSPGLSRSRFYYAPDRSGRVKRGNTLPPAVGWIELGGGGLSKKKTWTPNVPVLADGSGSDLTGIATEISSDEFDAALTIDGRSAQVNDQQVRYRRPDRASIRQVSLRAMRTGRERTPTASCVICMQQVRTALSPKRRLQHNTIDILTQRSTLAVISNTFLAFVILR